MCRLRVLLKIFSKTLPGMGPLRNPEAEICVKESQADIRWDIWALL